MVGARNPDEIFGFAGEGNGGFDLRDGAERVVVAADEELGLGASAEEIVAVIAAFSVDGEAEGDESGDTGIAATGLEADPGAEGESGEKDGAMELAVEPGEGGADVVQFAAAEVVLAFAEPGSAEIEAKDGEAEGLEGLHGVVDDFVVEGAAAQGVRMADEGGEGRRGRADVEQGLKPAGGGAEIVDGAEEGGAGGMGHQVQGTGSAAHPVPGIRAGHPADNDSLH